MSLSQTQQSEDLHDQTTILIGSAIRLLCGEAGVFVVASEAFDPQSNAEYILYRLNASVLPLLLSSIQEDIQPTSACPLVVSALSPTLVAQLGLSHDDIGGLSDAMQRPIERCSLRLQDQAGVLGVIHYLRPAGTYSCFERHTESDGSLHLFIAHLAASLRAILKSQALMNMHAITREREQEEQRSTFISVISHELQTPIAIIKGYASTLARTDAMLDPEALRSRLLAVEEEADRLNKLVGNLLYASRIQAGGLQMEIAPLDLSRLVQGVVRRLRAKSPDGFVTLNIPPHLPAVMADRDRIEEVLQNLLDNAIKYSPQHPAVTITCRATGDEVIVTVSDAGIGIPLRDQAQIFNRFQRGGNHLTPTLPGAGLGLYICRAIVEAHGGQIWVESTLHEGSTFSFSLPRVEKAQLPMVVF